MASRLRKRRKVAQNRASAKKNPKTGAIVESPSVRQVKTLAQEGIISIDKIRQAVRAASVKVL